MELRPYQDAAVEAVWYHLRMRDDNPCVVIPTAGGKSLVIAELCRQAVMNWKARVLVLTHIKELVEQNSKKLVALLGPSMVGVYSTGLKSRDTNQPVIAAGIQSIYKRAKELGPYDLFLIDECHLLPPDRSDSPNNSEGMYRSFIADARILNPHLRIVGFTATPYRMASGSIYGEKNILHSICYEIGVRELIDLGFLSPLTAKAGKQRVDTSGLHIRAGEFMADEAETLMDTESLVRSAVHEIVDYTADRNACLIFAAGIKHGEHIVRVFNEEHGIECGFITGSTPVSLRDKLIRRFKGPDGEQTREEQAAMFTPPEPPSEPLKYLCNVNVLTTGFDAPRIDCIAMLRPTMSPGLYYQCLGRGFRLAPGKTNCLILDFADNVLRHGPVDCIQVGSRGKGTGDAPMKICPQCNSIIFAGFGTCPDCGYLFPKSEAKHSAHAGKAAVLSGEVTIEEYEVREVSYSVHRKRGAAEDYPKTMMVEYRVCFEHWQSEFLCPEHTGYARTKFEKWWLERTDMPLPDTAADAVAIAQAGGLAETKKITVRSVSGEEFDRITKYELGEKPGPVVVETEDQRIDRMRREDGWDDFAEFPAAPKPAFDNDDISF